MKRALVLVCLLAACMPASARRAKRLEGRYTVTDPGDGWKKVDPGGADRAWYNGRLGATIYTDSNCGPRYDELAAADLATELVAGLRDEQKVRDEPVTLAGREGVLRVHTGTIDGVPVELGLLVVNRDACTYDFTLISPPDRFDAGEPDWERVWKGFAPR